MESIKIVSSMKYAGRKFVIVELFNGAFKTMMYRSSGHNSGQPGKWFPAAGTLNKTDNSWEMFANILSKRGFDLNQVPDGWIIKQALVVGNGKRNLYNYRGDRLHFPKSPINYFWLSSELTKLDDQIIPEADITAEGINAWWKYYML